MSKCYNVQTNQYDKILITYVLLDFVSSLHRFDILSGIEPGVFRGLQGWRRNATVRIDNKVKTKKVVTCLVSHFH
jgi:hypothetical protein